MPLSPRRLTLALIVLAAACGAPQAVKIDPPSPTSTVAHSAVGKSLPTTTTTVDPNVETWNMARVLIAQAATQTAAKRAERPYVDIGSAAQTVNHAPHSEAWWRAIAICEQGGRNHPFFGYFSIMDGSSGGYDWATQVQMAQRIINRAGDYAWADKCVHDAYRAAPGG